MGSEQRNALMAVVLSGLILFGWQYYFSPPQPAQDAPIEPGTKIEQLSQANANAVPAPASGPIEPAAAELFTLEAPGISVAFDSTLTIKDFDNQQAAFSFEKTVSSQQPMQVEFDFGNGFRPLSFARTEEQNKFYNSTYDATVFASINEKGVASFKANSPKPFKYRFVFKTDPMKLENAQERVFAYHTDELNRTIIGEEEAGDMLIKWAGIDFNYHLFAAFFEKARELIVQINGATFNLYSNKNVNELQYNLVFVKKEYNDLTALGHNLNSSVDFGIWGFFAVWILKGLQFFYTLIPNWGVAIILLTLLIRLITFPLQYKSFVSMKKLQLIQPELTKIREKFKDDPQRMQKESMELFRKSGANPIGGCLPLLLQMPVFFAFYKVLNGAVELVDAPLIFWIHDLSNKDPYYVLPVLMTGAMFLQQKLTPNTITDPVQKRIMLFMPLIFGFIMKDLPSGLSLYIFVSTIFGIIQQLLVFNSKKSTPVVV